ncbi:MAG: DUF378 domain-containing protein [Candidatus Gracilibacteria bacterium]|nr:DUF378 domain-containing protein [Candidatus Gracilibacteria bacterium]
MKSTFLGIVTFLLVIIGAVNWGLVGVFDFNLVTWLFGAGVVTQVIYILVGVSALVQLGMWSKK